jgi:hypothetical protein
MEDEKNSSVALYALDRKSFWEALCPYVYRDFVVRVRSYPELDAKTYITQQINLRGVDWLLKKLEVADD